MSLHDQEYLNHVQTILNDGYKKEDRTENGTVSLFGTQNVYDLKHGFPLLTVRELGFKTILRELLWFIKGSTNIRGLVEAKCNIWNDDAYRFYTEVLNGKLSKEEFLEKCKAGEFSTPLENGESYFYGDLGKVYGYQWNKPVISSTGKTLFPTQLDYVLDQCLTNPNSRRILLECWDPSDMLDQFTALPCCHTGFQCYVVGNRIDLKFNMRSNDVFLGAPFNIASYAILLQMLCHLTGKVPGRIIHHTGDAHLYNGHLPFVEELLRRDTSIKSPLLFIKNRGQKRFHDFVEEDFELVGYNPLPKIQAPLFV